MGSLVAVCGAVAGMLTLLRHNRYFSIFLVTQAASNLGDAARNLIVPLLVLQITHSPTLVAAVLLMQTGTRLVLRLPFGALLDRWDRRRTMLLADLGRGILTLLIPLAAALHGRSCSCYSPPRFL